MNSCSNPAASKRLRSEAAPQQRLASSAIGPLFSDRRAEMTNATIDTFIAELRVAAKVRGLVTEEHIEFIRAGLFRAHDAASEFSEFVDVWDDIAALISNRRLTVKERLLEMGRIGELLERAISREDELMAIGGGTFTAIGGGISDLFAASADRSKAQGDLMEAANYDLAAKYAYQEEQFTKELTAIQGMQAERQHVQLDEPDQGGHCRWWLCSIRLRSRHPGAVCITGRAAAGRHRKARLNY